MDQRGDCDTVAELAAAEKVNLAYSSRTLRHGQLVPATVAVILARRATPLATLR